MVSHHPANFCGNKYCDSENIMVLFSQVIPRDHVSKGWSYIMGRSPLWQVISDHRQ